MEGNLRQSSVSAKQSLADLSRSVIKLEQKRAPLYHGSSFIPASDYRGGHPAALSSSVIKERKNEASKQCHAVSTKLADFTEINN
jgi:hypothetical protein